MGGILTQNSQLGTALLHESGILDVMPVKTGV